MARITLFWCFEEKKILNRMMEFQVKFCHHSGLRLWRTGMLFSTKSKCHKSKFRISWMYRYSFYGLKVHFWWPNKCLVSLRPYCDTYYYYNQNHLMIKRIPRVYIFSWLLPWLWIFSSRPLVSIIHGVLD